jgi:hypothetical protein
VAQQLFLPTNYVDFFNCTVLLLISNYKKKFRHDEEAMQLRPGQEVSHEKKQS